MVLICRVRWWVGGRTTVIASVYRFSVAADGCTAVSSPGLQSTGAGFQKAVLRTMPLRRRRRRLSLSLSVEHQRFCVRVHRQRLLCWHRIRHGRDRNAGKLRACDRLGNRFLRHGFYLSGRAIVATAVERFADALPAKEYLFLQPVPILNHMELRNASYQLKQSCIIVRTKVLPYLWPRYELSNSHHPLQLWGIRVAQDADPVLEELA